MKYQWMSVVLLCLTLASFAIAQNKPVTVDNFKDLKYGMFIHFGMSTFTGKEIDPGDQPSTTYAPTNLDVDQWIKVAHDAGMKYAVLTSKHVAGHCLWDSKVPFRGKEFDYDVATSGNKTDVIADFVKACKKYDIMPGLYYCLLDFRNNSVPHGPQWSKGNLPDDFFELAKGQISELIANYPDIHYFWLDIPRAASKAQRQALYDLIKTKRPGTIVLFNNGTTPPGGPVKLEQYRNAWPTDVLNTERNPLKPGQFSPKLALGDRTYTVAYEHCDCLARNWFWVEGDRPRSASTIYRLHRDTVAGGGNLLLDVAPDRTGQLPAYSIAALAEVKKLIDDPSLYVEPVSLRAKASASNVYKNDAQYAAAAAVDGDEESRWATDDKTTSAWLEIDLGKPTSINRVRIAQAYPELKRIKSYAIEYRDGDGWKSCYAGKDMPAAVEAPFDPVTAQVFRLNITQATDGPTIYEFQLFSAKK